jgi:hypothetical protein
MTGRGKSIFSIGKAPSKSSKAPKSIKSDKKVSVASTTRKLKRPGKKWAKIEERKSRSKSRSRSRSNRPASPSRKFSRSPSPLGKDKLQTSIPLKYHEAIKAQFVNGNRVPVKVVRGKWTLLSGGDAYMTGYAHPLAKDGSLLKVKVLLPSSDGERIVQKIIPVTDLKLRNPSDIFNIIPRKIKRNEVGYVDPYGEGKKQYDMSEEWEAEYGGDGGHRSRSRSRSRSSSRSSGYATSRSSSKSRSRSRSKSRSRSRSGSRSGSPTRLKIVDRMKALGQRRKRSRSL